MTGEQLQEKLSVLRISQSELALKLGMSQQNLNRALNIADIKTSMLEKICSVYNLPMSFFYPEDSLANNNLYQTGDGNQQNSGDNVQQTMGADKELVNRLVDELSELRKTNQKLTEKLLSQ